MKQEALEKDQKEKIQSKLKDIERMGQSVDYGKVSLHQEIRNHLRQEQQEQQRRNQRLEEIKEELKEESSHLQSHRSIRPLNLRDIPPEVGDESISVSKSIEEQHQDQEIVIFDRNDAIIHQNHHHSDPQNQQSRLNALN